MQITEENLKEALRKVVEPDLKKDIITLDLVSDIKIDGNNVSFTVKVFNPAMHAKKRMEEALEFALERAFGKDVNANVFDYELMNMPLLLEIQKVVPVVNIDGN